MKYSNILLTGGSGKLGRALLTSKLKNRKILAPAKAEMDITNFSQVESFFKNNKIDAVIHCAAFTSVPECEKNPVTAVEANIVGTSNVVKAALKKENTRLIYISTDYVYPCKNGPYSERDPAIPFTVYAWTKLGGECAIKALKNHCIIRTSFFDPDNIKFDTAASDAFFSKIPINELVENIISLLDSDFTGTINVGQERASIYQILKKYKPSLRPMTVEELSRDKPFDRALDSSLDVGLWQEISAKIKKI